MDPAALRDALDPISEAQAQLAGVAPSAHTIVLLGAGLGVVTEMAATRWPAATVIVLEPSAEIARVARQKSPSIYESGRVRVLVGPDYGGAAELWKVFDRPEAVDPSGLAVVRHAALTLTMPVEVAKAYRLVARAIDAANMNRRAREENAGRYLLNTLRNLPAILCSGDPAQLVGRLAGVPAIVVGAGPSLDRQLDDLRAVAARAVIVAADTAWRPLVTAGIDPHFVVALDPTEVNGRHLRGVSPSRETWGIVEGSVAPAGVGGFGDSLFTFRVGDHHPWPWLESLGLQRPIVRAWGSVLTSAFDLALAFGCDPVLFAGSDLAFTDGRPYCRGTTFEEDWARHTARGASLRQVWHNTLSARKLLTESSLTGDAVPTAPHMIEFRNWIVRRAGEASASSQRVFNTTPAGILSGGVIQRGDLRTLLADRPERDTEICDIARGAVRRKATTPAAETLTGALIDLERDTRSDLIREWLTFGRPSLTVDAISSAAATARAQLKTASRLVSGDAENTARGRIEAPGLPKIHVADRVARMRARLSGDNHGLEGCVPVNLETEFGDVDPAETTRQLVCSLLALPQLTTGWGEDVARGSEPATIPLSLRHVWTADARPLVDSLEGWMLHPKANDRLASSTASGASHFWSCPIAPTSDEEPAFTDASGLPSEIAARGALTSIWAAQFADSRAGRLHAALEDVAGPANRFDVIARAITGTIATSWPPAGDPRRAFVKHEVGYVEPEVLTDRGLPLGWSTVTIGARRALFTPRGFDHSVAIDASGQWTATESWPHPIVGETPRGNDGGWLAWNPRERLILSRRRPDGEVGVDHVSFQPSRSLQMPDGTLVWLALDGGLWEWSEGTSGRRLIDTPRCAGIELSGDELVLAPIAIDQAGQVHRRRLRFEWRYRLGDTSLRRVAGGPEGPFAGRSTQGEWTARAHPYADLIALHATDGRSFVLAVHSPFQPAWAGPSLVVIVTDGVSLIFRNLLDQLESGSL